MCVFDVYVYVCVGLYVVVQVLQFGQLLIVLLVLVEELIWQDLLLCELLNEVFFECDLLFDLLLCEEFFGEQLLVLYVVWRCVVQL